MERPFVYVNMAMTADGKITSAQREYPRFTSPEDRRTMDRLRAEADALLVGAQTVRADDPRLGVRDPEMRRYRESLGRGAGLLRVLVTASADVPLDSRFFGEADAEGGGIIVATVDDAPPERLAALREAADVWCIGSGTVDLPALLRRLKIHGVERLLAEGGGELNWHLLRDDLIDELYVTIAPRLLGGSAAPTLLEGPGLRMREQRTLRLLEVRREGDELYCRYAVVR